MKSKFFLYFLFALLPVSCSSDYSPKPKGYFYIDLPEPDYKMLNTYPFFEFEISNQVIVEAIANKGKETKWFNLNYSRYNARIYCSYFQTTKKDFPVLAEESRRMAYVQEKKAKGVTESEFSHPEQKVYGLVYEIQGDAASPIQFVISDSTHSFFRGALYFDDRLNRDSIAPVLSYIKKDIHVILESFRWKQ